MYSVPIAVFIATTLGTYLFLERYSLVKKQKSRLLKLLKPREEELPKEKEGTSLLVRFLKKIAHYVPLHKKSKIAQELERAGLPLNPGEFVALNLLAGIAPLVFFATTGRMLFALLSCFIGFLVPQFVLRNRQGQRKRQFASLLPEGLVMLSNSLKAGYSFLQAMELVSREIGDPLSCEFEKCLKEMSLGLATEEALEHAALRMGCPDFDLVVTAVLIQRQVGGNLSEILDTIAHTIRERIRIQGEIRTLTAQGKISGMVIGLLPLVLALFVFIINPDYIKPLFVEPLGRAMLGLGAMGQVMAMVIIRKIVNIEV